MKSLLLAVFLAISSVAFGQSFEKGTRSILDASSEDCQCVVYKSKMLVGLDVLEYGEAIIFSDAIQFVFPPTGDEGYAKATYLVTDKSSVFFKDDTRTYHIFYVTEEGVYFFELGEHTDGRTFYITIEAPSGILYDFRQQNPVIKNLSRGTKKL